MNIKIRAAKKTDGKEIIKLIEELAMFEKLPTPDKNAKNRLLKDAFGNNPPFYILVAEEERKIVGYAFYFFAYSSFLAKRTLYLEDIFITESRRNQGIGKLFWNKLLQIARKNSCGRMEWCVLDWNKNAIRFYEKLGASELKDWIYYRLSL